jgi:predicted transcriptional regulator
MGGPEGRQETTSVAVNNVVVVVRRSGMLKEQEERGRAMGVKHGVCMFQPISLIGVAAQKKTQMMLVKEGSDSRISVESIGEAEKRLRGHFEKERKRKKCMRPNQRSATQSRRDKQQIVISVVGHVTGQCITRCRLFACSINWKNSTRYLIRFQSVALDLVQRNSARD